MKTPITVAAYAHATAAPGQAALADPMQTRRMSWMQKATLDCFLKLRPEVDAGGDGDERFLVAFATRFGEVDATLAVADAILRRTLPVSPTAFQHSVHNAAAGYVLIASGRRDPSITTASGFLSLDLLLYWVAHELSAGLLDRALVLSATENAVPAACEGLLLSRRPAAGALTLMAAKYAGDSRCYDRIVRDLEPLPRYLAAEIQDPLAACPLRLDRVADAAFHRITRSAAGESVFTSWRRSNDSSFQS